jgi:hypothetical protein
MFCLATNTMLSTMAPIGSTLRLGIKGEQLNLEVLEG